MIEDFKAVRVTGAYDVVKARMLMRGNEVRLYDKSGKMIERFEAFSMIRIPLSIWQYRAMTKLGSVKIERKCFTCGGWWKVMKVPAKELWSG